ncbi:MAG TPA: terminase family protein [Candidatus Bathyarchaeia archaeon]|nr:terminase family protein [Candidatus Bathyarchaeia archaeon]
MKTIPQNALPPLTELCRLLSQILNTEPITTLKNIIQAMNTHSDYFFNQPWPRKYNFNQATECCPADLDFINNQQQNENLNPTHLLCIKKNINHQNGFTPIGFLWTLWTLNQKLNRNPEAPLLNIQADPSLFARLLVNWHPFPYQEKLLADQSKRIVSCWGRQCGKTTTVAVKAIHYAYTNPNTTVLVASPSLRQSIIMLDRIQELIENSLILRQGVAKQTKTEIHLHNNSLIVALPCSEDLLRGYTADHIICDEAAFMPEETITQVMFPMLSATDGSAIFLSTPWGKNHFYKAYTNPDYSVHHARSIECPLIKTEFLHEQKRILPDEIYRSEYLAEFTEAAHCFFPQDLIRTCIDPTLEQIADPQAAPDGTYYAGVDFGKLNDHTAIAIIKHEQTTLKLVHIHEFPLGTPYSHVIGYIANANKRIQFEKLCIDQTGVGEPIQEELRNQDIQNIEGVTFTTQTKEALLTNLKLAMEQHRLKLSYNRPLINQINQQQYAYNKTGHLSFSHPQGIHDDQLWALSLAAYAAQRQPEPTLRIAT